MTDSEALSIGVNPACSKPLFDVKEFMRILRITQNGSCVAGGASPVGSPLLQDTPRSNTTNDYSDDNGLPSAEFFSDDEQTEATPLEEDNQGMRVVTS